MNNVSNLNIICPECKGHEISNLTDNSSKILCKSCKSEYYQLTQNSFHLVSSSKSISNKKKEIQAFWGDLYKQWYEDFDSTMTPKILEENLISMEELFHKRKLLPVIEMDYKNLKGKKVLEIGCGGGGHSSFFKKMGAIMTSIDITPERVTSTAKKFNFIQPNESGIVCLADAENLPFKDESFDIVYSNGVLHHSENTERCISEVKRVLKNDGTAVLMLYSRYSVQYLANCLIKAILTGEFFKYPEAEWLGRITEGKPKHNSTKNPLTRVYSAKQIKNLLKDFDLISLRKNGFLFSQFPLMSKLRTLVMSKLLKKKPLLGGTILYGEPFIAESALETSLAPYLGWSWNIIARKKLK